jgi:hypothetical protein
MYLRQLLEVEQCSFGQEETELTEFLCLSWHFYSRFKLANIILHAQTPDFCKRNLMMNLAAYAVNLAAPKDGAL